MVKEANIEFVKMVNSALMTRAERFLYEREDSNAIAEEFDKSKFDNSL